MAGWHQQSIGLEPGQTPGDGGGLGSLVCCSPWGRKESDTTELTVVRPKALFEDRILSFKKKFENNPSG